MSMTREEALALLNEQYEICKRIYDCSADQRKSYPNVPQFMEALGMALSALRPITWEGVEAPVATPEWNVAAGKIDVINNICHAVHNMNTCSRSDGEKAQKPVLKDGVSVVHSDYANGTAKTETQRWREWVCPVCGWFVGERLVHSHIGTHDPEARKRWKRHMKKEEKPCCQ